MLADSLIHRSGQTWKVALGLSACGIAFVFMMWGEQFSTRLGFELEVSGTLACLTALAVTVAAVRCQRCGMPWLWAAVRNQGVSQWAGWLVAQKVCPRCGYNPSPAESEKA